MLEILGRSTSINVRKVLWTCAELGLPYRHEEWGAGELSLQSPEYLALNPNALVPVMSRRRLRAVGVQHHLPLPGGAAGPRTTCCRPNRAPRRVEQWMDWQATELNNAWRYAFMALVRKKPGARRRGAVEASVPVEPPHALLDAAAARSGAFVAGAAFTLADVVLGLATHRWLNDADGSGPILPAVTAYYDRLVTAAGLSRPWPQRRALTLDRPRRRRGASAEACVERGGAAPGAACASGSSCCTSR